LHGYNNDTEFLTGKLSLCDNHGKVFSCNLHKLWTASLKLHYEIQLRPLFEKNKNADLWSEQILCEENEKKCMKTCGDNCRICKYQWIETSYLGKFAWWKRKFVGWKEWAEEWKRRYAIFLFSKTSRPALVPNSGVHSLGKSGRGVEFTTYFHFVPRLRMNRAIHLLSLHAFMSCSRTALSF
jgi:hypothetical protein